ncbi:trehalose-phosphatase [Natrarchaeobaculum aegyptiacum]|uniref:Trehalose 6-phosphate phosphatase n=1 Tax=Natrarchaeobaculum aegyptiacum TaxID=745377 RepID=A0A2Z2I1G1_9EURY|nr:trehalose-phosphatase [Natrarchaeobaculum aegyptiacum]
MPDDDAFTPPLEERRDALRGRIAEARHLLVCLDFDGTLAPIVEEPDEAMPLPEAETAVEALTDAVDVTTAVVSGRALADVRERIDGPRLYAGNHGLELARDGPDDREGPTSHGCHGGANGREATDEPVAVHPIARKRARQVDAVCTALESATAQIPNVGIENKRLTATVHVRTVPPAFHGFVRETTHRLVDRFAGDALEVSTGKQILEIGPAIPWGKGNAVRLLAADSPPGTVTIYVGDDVTDESAFRAIHPDGIGVYVGEDGDTAASCRVPDPEAVARFLRWLEAIAVLDRHPT